jgi:hypothetical protein
MILYKIEITEGLFYINVNLSHQLITMYKDVGSVLFSEQVYNVLISDKKRVEWDTFKCIKHRFYNYLKAERVSDSFKLGIEKCLQRHLNLAAFL